MSFRPATSAPPGQVEVWGEPDTYRLPYACEVMPSLTWHHIYDNPIPDEPWPGAVLIFAAVGSDPAMHEVRAGGEPPAWIDAWGEPMSREYHEDGGIWWTVVVPGLPPSA